MHIVVSVALALGALDSVQFAGQNRKRARQSLAVAAVWTVGFIFSLFSSTALQIATLIVAVVLTAGGLALLIVHVRHGIANARVWLAPVLAIVALIAVIVRL